jgi:hypothetical protein
MAHRVLSTFESTSGSTFAEASAETLAGTFADSGWFSEHSRRRTVVPDSPDAVIWHISRRGGTEPIARRHAA